MNIQYYKTYNFTVFGYTIWKLVDDKIWYIYVDSKWVKKFQGWYLMDKSPVDYLKEIIRFGKIHSYKEKPSIKKISKEEVFLELL